MSETSNENGKDHKEMGGMELHMGWELFVASDQWLYQQQRKSIGIPSDLLFIWAEPVTCIAAVLFNRQYCRLMTSNQQRQQQAAYWLLPLFIQDFGHRWCTETNKSKPSTAIQYVFVLVEK